MSTRRGLVNNLFLGAGVGVNLYGAYFVLAFQGHLPPDWLPGAVLGYDDCLLYTSPSPRDQRGSRMPSSA